MARTMDAESHRMKKQAILDVLEELMISNGYDHVTVADILTRARISKGAFYHYFSAKSEVLTALLEQRLERWEKLLAPIVEGEEPALVRLQRFLAALSGTKAHDRTLLVAVAAPVFADENAVVQVRMRRAAAALFTPYVERLLDDARREGTLRTDEPAALADVVTALMQALTDGIGRGITAIARGDADPATLSALTTVYVGALHRVLSLEPGRLDFISDDEIRAWAAAAAAERKEGE